ncbi:MAG TPA: glycosyltransferase family 4 protein [Parafilimonas sp.]|jgi:glycosyltransferase involved in cell wall biosynthesis
MYKIVQIVPALGWGGAQVFCMQLCNQLAQYPGYNVTLISLYNYNAEKHLPLSMLDKKVKFISLDKKPGIDVSIFKKVYKVLKDIKPDVVHTHLHAGYYCFFAYYKLKYPFKKIHTLHNLAKEDAPLHGRKLYKYCFKRDIIHPVTISEEVYKSAVAEYGSFIKTLINNGSNPVLPTNAFTSIKEKIHTLKKDASTKILLNVARITRQKNQQLLIECMQKLQEKNVNAIAIVLGDYVPVDKNIYDELIAKKPANVHFLGKVSNVSDYLLQADAFVLTSTFEGLPISLLEALSAGAAPICTPVGGIKNIVTEDIGFLSADVSVNAYTKTLEDYFNTNNTELNRIKQNGQRLYEQEFSMQSCAAKYDVLYHAP